MPFYQYHCKQCNNYFTLFLKMGVKQEICIICKAVGTVERVYDNFNVLKKEEKEAGKIVDSFIKETKEDLKEQQKELKEKEYK